MRTLSLFCSVLTAWCLGATAARGDLIADWHQTARDYLMKNTNGVETLRGMAMVHVAQFDAVNAAIGGFTPYALRVVAREASAEAAAALAAYTVLTNLSRADLATVDAALAQSLAGITAGRSREDGIALGRLAAETVVQLRAADNMNLRITPPGSSSIGKWRPAPPGFEAGVGAQMRYLLPWTMPSQARFRPVPPPDLKSAAYAADWSEVRLVGASGSTNRTESMTAAARFHAAGDLAYLVPARARRTLPLVESARLHALYYMVLFDANIAFMEAQYHYSFWRPITAIRAAANDGNDLTAADAMWTPFLDTPSHPEYPSGTCATTAGLVGVLIHFFGDDFALRATSQNGPSRDFERLSAAVSDAVEARIAAGAHFRTSCTVGVELGRTIARHAIDHFLLPLPSLKATQPSPGEFALHLQPGRPASYVIEFSADLSQWTPWQTNATGILLHSDTTAGAVVRRFYRALLHP